VDVTYEIVLTVSSERWRVWDPWPWVDPTGTTQLYVLPATQRYNAILAGGTGIPAAPTNLRIIR
jgi:hypothetical protein